MTESDLNSDLVAELAEEFVERYRAGERPPLSEYTDKYPALADEIRDVFPALVMVENLAPKNDESIFDAQRQQCDVAVSIENRQLDDYHIIREVGRGGMGIVYEAEQESLGRRVALKVLPKQMMLEKSQRKRFEREAKAAAKLHHTNIVPVFGVGVHEGLHFYAMQFIQGLGLDEVLVELRTLREQTSGVSEYDKDSARNELKQVDRLRSVRTDVSAVAVARSLVSGQFERTLLLNDLESVDSGPTASESSFSATDTPHEIPASATRDTAVGRLSDTHLLSKSVVLPGQTSDGSHSKSAKATYVQSVARIGVQVAEALDYAHEQGILHRDIKPSNLLLDTRGTVWVTDFGLAKADDHENLTGTGDIVGTLRYMAPEMFNGKSDVRSDIYALGLTLYELLTLKPAFDETDRHKLIRQVGNQTPERLRKFDAQIPKDLETIVHKAIDRDPSHRYQSAAELARDLERYLKNEPIRARRISPVARFSRWCKRNPALAVATNAVVLLLMMITLVSVFAYQQTAAALSQVQESEKQARDSAQRANTEAATAKQVKEVLVGLFVDPDGGSGFGYQWGAVRQKGTTLTARDILDRAKTKLDELDDQPDVQVTLMDTVGNIYRSLGHLDKAEPLLTEALARRRETHGPEHRDTAASLDHLAGLCYDHGNPMKAARLYREALTIRRKLPGDENVEVAETLFNLGWVETQNSREEEAAVYFQESLAIRQKLLQADHRDVGMSLWGVAWNTRRQTGGLNQQQLKLKRAITKAFNERAKKIFAAIDDGVNAGMAACLLLDAYIEHSSEQSEEFHLAIKEAVTLARQVLGEEHPLLTIVMKDQAYGLQKSGKRQEAETVYRELLAIRRKIYGEEHHLVAESMVNLVTAMDWPAEREEAQELCLMAAKISDKDWGQHLAESETFEYRELQTWESKQRALGRQLQRVGLPNEAVKCFRRALEMREKAFRDFPHEFDTASGRLRVFHAQRVLGFAQSDAGDLAGALEMMRKADAFIDARLAEDPGSSEYQKWTRNHIGDLLQAWQNYGDELKKQKKQDEAEKINREMQQYVQATDDPEVSSILANHMTQAGKHAEAEQLYRQSLILYDKRIDGSADNRDYRVGRGRTLWRLGEVLKETKHYDGAEKAFLEALAIFKKLSADFPDHDASRWEWGFSHWQLGWLMATLGRHADAQQHWREGLAVYAIVVEDFPDKAGFQKRLARSHDLLVRNLIKQGKHAEAEQLYREAVENSSKAIELKPDAPGRWSNRARYYCQLGQWDEAVADFAKAIKLEPDGAVELKPDGAVEFKPDEAVEFKPDGAVEFKFDQAVVHYWRALAQLGAGDIESYRSACGEMLERFVHTENPETAKWVAWTCALAPDAVADLSQAVTLANKASKKNPRTIGSRRRSVRFCTGPADSKRRSSS